jgi:hypothetical protein
MPDFFAFFDATLPLLKKVASKSGKVAKVAKVAKNENLYL